MVIRILKTATLVIGTLIMLCSCAANNSGTVAQQRSSILKMQQSVLAQLYKEKPNARQQIMAAPGYAVFDNANVNLLLASFGGGYGVVTDNGTGKHTYMKMAEVGLGLGAGVKDFRVVFVFNKRDTMKRFVDEGWAFGAQADAAAKASDKGGAVAGEVTADNITIYQLTESGLALQATVKGTKYWKDDKLN